jgi:NADP-dependent 3-hydroxy acid dehydrogenase YdfG
MGARDQELTGRVAIVTGAGAGIGAGIAAMLAEAGAAVTVADIDGESAASTAKAIEKRGGRAITVTADVSDARDIDAMVRQTVTDLGGVDILVNNAGLGRSAPLSSAPTELWREMLDVNVLGLCIASREAIADMERRGSAGHIVHVSSMAGHRVPSADSGFYAATKFAVRALTEGLRQELRARQSAIRVTAVSPGHVFTEFADVFSGVPGAEEEIARRFKILEPRDVAEAILWIVSRPPHMEVHDILVRPTAQRN